MTQFSSLQFSCRSQSCIVQWVFS